MVECVAHTDFIRRVSHCCIALRINIVRYGGLYRRLEKLKLSYKLNLKLELESKLWLQDLLPGGGG